MSGMAPRAAALSMEALPDNVLVTIFGFLSLEERWVLRGEGSLPSDCWRAPTEMRIACGGGSLPPRQRRRGSHRNEDLLP